MIDTTTFSNSLIKEVATDAMIERGSTSDIDSCTQTGFWFTSGSTKGSFPPNFTSSGIVEVFQRWGGVLQRYTCLNGKMASRYMVSQESGWGNWIVYSMA